MNNPCHSTKRRYGVCALAIIILTAALMYLCTGKASTTEGSFDLQTPYGAEAGCTGSTGKASTTEGTFASQTPYDTEAGCTGSTGKASTTEGTFDLQTPSNSSARVPASDTDNESLGAAEDELADVWERFLALLPPEIFEILSGDGAKAGSVFEIISVFAAVLGSEMGSVTSIIATVVLVTVLFAIAEIAVKERAEVGQTVIGGICVILSSPSRIVAMSFCEPRSCSP